MSKFNFYHKENEDDALLVQIMGDARKEGQKQNFGLLEGLVQSTSAPSIAPVAAPLTLSPSQAELVPTTSPSEAIPAETAEPTLKPTKAPSIAPSPGVTSLKPSATPTLGSNQGTDSDGYSRTHSISYTFTFRVPFGDSFSVSNTTCHSAPLSIANKSSYCISIRRPVAIPQYCSKCSSSNDRSHFVGSRTF